MKLKLVTLSLLILTGCTPFQAEQSAPIVTGSTCVPGSTNLHQKKIRRLTQSQLKKVTAKVYSSRTGSPDFSGFFAKVSDLGFSEESEKLNIDEMAYSRLVESTESLNATNLRIDSLNDKTVCANAVNFVKEENQCVQHILNKYTKILWRRPALPEEIQIVKNDVVKIQKDFNLHVDQLVKYVHRYMLLHTAVLHRTELGFLNSSLDNIDKQIVDLDQFEIASFLSFTIIDEGPDDQLYSNAEKGLLKDFTVLESEVNRLFANPNAKELVKSVMVDFLKINKLPSMDIGKWGKFVYDGNFAIPLTVRQQLNDGKWHDQAFRVNQNIDKLYNESLEFIDSRLGSDLNYMNVFSGNVFPTSNYTIANYGVRDLAGLSTLLSGATPNGNGYYHYKFNYTAPMNQRNGILTHPAFLGVHSTESNSGMVVRGVFMLEQLLCQHMPGAPADVFPRTDLPPGYDPTILTSRKKFEILHSQQTACYSCHRTIDNIGGSFENFDNTGYFTTKEKFAYEGRNYELDIDSSGELNGLGNIDIKYANTVDFIKKVQETSDFKNCINTKLLEYINGEKTNSSNSCGYDLKSSQVTRKPNSNYKDLILTNIKDMNFFKRQTAGGK